MSEEEKLKLTYPAYRDWEYGDEEEVEPRDQMELADERNEAFSGM